MTPKAAAARVRNELRAAATGDVDHARFFKDNQPVKLLGLKTKELRAVARGVYADVKKNWTVKDAQVFLEALLADDYLDMRHCGLLVFGRFSKGYAASLLPAIRAWIESGALDNWSSIDLLCADILSPLVEAHPELLKKTATWTKSKSLWLRRASAVCLVKPARKGRFHDEAFAAAHTLFGDPEDLVQKALGWLLKEAGNADAARLEAFVTKHGKQMSRTSLRYAIEKFPPAKRKRLLETTRP